MTRSGDLTVTAVETFVLSDRLALVKVSTASGICGWGEAVAEGWARTTVAAVERMAVHLLGADARRITDLWQVLTRGGFYRGGPVLGSAVAGLDQALWDIKGRYHRAPVFELLGGPTRDHVRVYSHAGRDDRTGDPARARALVAAGISMVKCAPRGPVEFVSSAGWIDALLADVAELRAAIGPDVDLALDFHGRLSVAQSRRVLPLLEEFRPAFVEEPLRPEHSALIGDVVRATSIPIATGERLYHRTEFRPVLEAGVAVVQPDLSHAGGITECLRIATQAEVYDAVMAPHCPLGPVALAACLQVDLAVPNVLAQEQVLDVHDPATAKLGLLVDPSVLHAVDGVIPAPTGHGLGVEVDEDAVRAAVVDGPLPPGSPVWRHRDGSFAEW